MAPFTVWCAEIGVPYTSARDAVLRGHLPIVRFNRNWYVDRRDGDRYIESLKETIGS